MCLSSVCPYNELKNTKMDYYQKSVNFNIQQIHRLPLQLNNKQIHHTLMDESNRHFGSDIQNIINNNHIVLRSSSFSFENKKKIYADGIQNKYMVRRQSMAQYHAKPYLRVEVLKARSIIQEKVCDRNSNSEDVQQQYLQNIKNDIQFIPEYLKNCLDYLILREGKRKINVQSIKQKNPMFIRNRPQIIDWLSKMHEQLELFPQTLSIAVNHFDRFLSKQKVNQKQLELVGLVCLLIAGKFEQTYHAPSIKSIIKVAKLKVEQSKILHLQEKILYTLQFALIYDTPIKYLQLFSKMINLSRKNQCILHYFIEMSMLDVSFTQFTPSKLASSVVYLIHKIRKISPTWPQHLKELTGYSETDLNVCGKMLCKLLEKDNSSFGYFIRKKYSKPEYCCASTIRILKKIQ